MSREANEGGEGDPRDSAGLKARPVIAWGGARSAQPQVLHDGISQALQGWANRFSGTLRQCRQKKRLVGLAAENPVPLISAAHHVINCTRVFDPHFRAM